MSHSEPRFFYIAHLHISHPLLLQKVVEQIKTIQKKSCHSHACGNLYK